MPGVPFHSRHDIANAGSRIELLAPVTGDPGIGKDMVQAVGIGGGIGGICAIAPYMGVKSTRTQNNIVVRKDVHADVFDRDHRRHVNVSGKSKSQVCGVLTHLQINGRRCTYDVADKRAAIDVVGAVDGAGCARVVLTVVRMGKNNGNVMQVYAVDFVEVKELITESDK